MSDSKYSRTVPVHCPNCAGTTFASPSDDSPLVTCSGCGLEITREDLRKANMENIQAHVNEVGKEVVADLSEQLKKSLADAFRGNKFIKIR